MNTLEANRYLFAAGPKERVVRSGNFFFWLNENGSISWTTNKSSIFCNYEPAVLSVDREFAKEKIDEKPTFLVWHEAHDFCLKTPNVELVEVSHLTGDEISIFYHDGFKWTEKMPNGKVIGNSGPPRTSYRFYKRCEWNIYKLNQKPEAKT